MPGSTTRSPARRSSCWSTAPPGARSGRGWPARWGSWPSWSGGPSTTGVRRPRSWARGGVARRSGPRGGGRRGAGRGRDPPGRPQPLPAHARRRLPARPRRARRVVATIGAHGITARLPDGFEGRIFVRPATVGVTYPVGPVRHVPHSRRHRRLRQRRRHVDGALRRVRHLVRVRPGEPGHRVVRPAGPAQPASRRPTSPP